MSSRKGNSVARVRRSERNGATGLDINKTFDAGVRARKALGDATPVPTEPMMTATVISATGIFTFGEALLRTNDLDPAYVAIHRANLPPDQQKRLVLAFCLFYSLGVAAKLSEYEGPAYWKQMLVAAANDDRWPRGRERRHFLKDTCVKAVRKLSTLAA